MNKQGEQMKKSIENMTAIEMRNRVNSLIIGCLGKRKEIVRGTDSLRCDTSIHPDNSLAALIAVALTDILPARDEDPYANNRIAAKMLESFENFKQYADEQLIVDIVRFGYLFDADKEAFYYNGDAIPGSGMHYFGTIPTAMSNPPAYQPRIRKELSEPSVAPTPEPSVTLKGFVLVQFSNEHGEFGFAIKPVIKGLESYGVLDEQKIQKVVDDLNAWVQRVSEQ